MKLLLTICTRGGSKGIPGKNIKKLNGKPLIEYSIEIAKRFRDLYENVEIVLSTDSDDIMKVAKECGLHSDYRRPDFLANDMAGKIDVIRDILLVCEKRNKKRYDYVLDLDVTSPLRTTDDLLRALEIIEKDTAAVNIFSVSKAGRNPYFNVVEKKSNGYYGIIKQKDELILTRQSAPEVYDMNASFYFYRRCFFDLGYKGVVTDRSLIYLMPHICFDLDHPIDFEIMSYLLGQDKLDFVLS